MWAGELSEEQVRRVAEQTRGRGPTVHALAAFINRQFADLRAEVRGCSETPYRLSGRTRWPCATKYGLKLEVWERRESFPAGIVRPVFEHRTTDRYRRNHEIARWIVDRLEGRPL